MDQRNLISEIVHRGLVSVVSEVRISATVKVFLLQKITRVDHIIPLIQI